MNDTSNTLQNQIDNISLTEDIELLLNIPTSTFKEFAPVYNQRFGNKETTGETIYIPIEDWRNINPDWAKNLIYTVGTDENIPKMAEQFGTSVTTMITYQVLDSAMQIFLDQYGKDLKIIKVTNKTFHCQPVKEVD